MTGPANPFLFASAPDSWGVLDYPGPSWNQSYEKMLDEMVEAGYTGTELGPYGYFPTDPEALRAQLEKRKLKLLGSFVPVRMGDLDAEKEVIERIRKVGDLLAKLKAPFLVLADDQTPGRNAFSGRANDPACPKLNAEQWKHVGKIVAGAEKVSRNFAPISSSIRTSRLTLKPPKKLKSFSTRLRTQESVSASTRATPSMPKPTR